MKMKFPYILILITLSTPLSAKKFTSASPEIQKEIMELITRQGKLGYGCNRSPKIKKIAINWHKDSIFDNSKKLIKGSAQEYWNISHCGKRANYGFKIGYDKSNQHRLLGFEIFPYGTKLKYP